MTVTHPTGAVLSFLIACGLLFVANPSVAAPIGIGDFSPTATFVDFSSPSFPTMNSRAFSVGEVTYRAIGDSLASHRAENLDRGGCCQFFGNIPSATGDWYLRTSGDLIISRWSFAHPLERVGMLLATAGLEIFTLEAFSVQGLSIESVSASNPAGGEAVFVGLATDGPAIAYIEITKIEDPNANFSTFFDDLRYEVVPEPSTALLSALGLVGLAVRRRDARLG